MNCALCANIRNSELQFSSLCSREPKQIVKMCFIVYNIFLQLILANNDGTIFEGYINSSYPYMVYENRTVDRYKNSVHTFDNVS